MSVSVPAQPRPFPRHGDLRPDTTAILVIDMQADFCAPGGYMDRLGYDLAPLRAPIDPIRRVLAAARPLGYLVVHTREGYRPDLADVQPWKRGDRIEIGEAGPLGRALVRGETGWDFIPEMAPQPGEPVFDKAGYGPFAFTDLDATLRRRSIANLIVTGVTTDCCVQSTVREALDRGYDCLVLEDCVAAGRRVDHEAALTLMRKPSGALGTVSDSRALIAALAPR
jgi:biuret amidohydrolase